MGVIGLAAPLSLATPAHAAANTATVSARVAPGSQTDATGTWYSITATPGAAVEQSIVIQNPNDHAATVRVEGVDGFTGDTAEASYGTPGSTPNGAGRWIAVSVPELNLDPGAETTVAFSVRVPSDAAPGEYLAGVSAAIPSGGSEASSPEGSAADIRLSLQAQRLIAVKVTVPGPASPDLVVTGATPFAGIDGVGLLVGIENVGNAFADGTAQVLIDGRVAHEFDISTFVPTTAIEYRVPWSEEIPDGSHAVAVQIDYGDGRSTNWTGTVDIDRSAREALAEDLANNRAPVSDDLVELPAPDAGEGGLPLAPIVAALGLGGLMTGGFLFLRRGGTPRGRVAS